jgi:hypothetical protein
MTFRNTLLESLEARDQREHKFHDIIVASKKLMILATAFLRPFFSIDNRLLQQNIQLEKRNKALESTKRDSDASGNAG